MKRVKLSFASSIFMLLFHSINTHAQLPAVSSGKIKRLENFSSRFISPRNIDVWLPDGYTDKKKYAVLYMQDGQMLFDNTVTWNKEAWDADDVLDSLLSANKVREAIIVGIWNGGATRHEDYFPQKPFEKLSPAEKDTVTAQLKKAGFTKEAFQPQSDNYLKFIVQELKPYIDKTFSTYPNKENTFLMGSSMGGLISIYAICEYPEVFGGAACLSTHWPGTFTLDNNPVPKSFINYLNKHLPSPAEHKIYFDCGDQTLDAFYPPIQKEVDTIMKAKGYTAKNWNTKYFPGENHSEKAWRKRLYIPLTFLLRK